MAVTAHLRAASPGQGAELDPAGDRLDAVVPAASQPMPRHVQQTPPPRPAAAPPRAPAPACSPPPDQRSSNRPPRDGPAPENAGPPPPPDDPRAAPARRLRHGHVQSAAAFLQAPRARGQRLGRVIGAVPGLDQLAVADLEEPHPTFEHPQGRARQIRHDAHPVRAEITGETMANVRGAAPLDGKGQRAPPRPPPVRLPPWRCRDRRPRGGSGPGWAPARSAGAHRCAGRGRSRRSSPARPPP
jgi:hypothetical protein